MSAPWICTSPRSGRAAISRHCWNLAIAVSAPCCPWSSRHMWGVSTRRVDDLVKALGCDGISKSQVSRICQELDEVVESFLVRSLGGVAYPHLWLDALTQKVREAGRIVNVSVVVATAVNTEGQREILGMDVETSEEGAFWLAFLRSLTARGLSGMELVTSNAHHGLRDAIATVFAGAAWQRGRTHFMTNLLTRAPKRAQPGVATMVRTFYLQMTPEEAHAQLDRVVEQLREPFPVEAAMLEDAGPDILAFTDFPVSYWQKLWSNNSLERLNKNKEIRWRTDVVGIFPNRGGGPPSSRCGAGRATRRRSRRPTLPHHTQRLRNRHPAGAPSAASSRLNNKRMTPSTSIDGTLPTLALSNTSQVNLLAHGWLYCGLSLLHNPARS